MVEKMVHSPLGCMLDLKPDNSSTVKREDKVALLDSIFTIVYLIGLPTST